MDPDVVYRVVIPTLTAGGVVAAITTWGKKIDSIATTFASLKRADGRPLFNTIIMDLVCDACKAKDSKKDQCVHKMGEIPYWQDEGRHKDVETMMIGERYDDYMREVRCVVEKCFCFVYLFVDSVLQKCATRSPWGNLHAALRGVQNDSETVPAFDRDALEYLRSDAAIYDQSDYVRHLFVMVDPAAGGAGSHYAVVSCFFLGGDADKMVVSAPPVSVSVCLSFRRRRLRTAAHRSKMPRTAVFASSTSAVSPMRCS